eukprot:scaffold9160_cov158-Amphora_coffeaeformis.AAC.1
MGQEMAHNGDRVVKLTQLCSDPSSRWQDMVLQMQGSIIINGKKWDSSVCLDPISRRRDRLRQSNGSSRGLLGLQGRMRSQTTAILRALGPQMVAYLVHDNNNNNKGKECTGRAIDSGLECTSKEVCHIWGEVCHISRVLIHERDRNSSLEWVQVFGPVSCSSPLHIATLCERKNHTRDATKSDEQSLYYTMIFEQHPPRTGVSKGPFPHAETYRVILQAVTPPDDPIVWDRTK